MDRRSGLYSQRAVKLQAQQGHRCHHCTCHCYHCLRHCCHRLGICPLQPKAPLAVLMNCCLQHMHHVLTEQPLTDYCKDSISLETGSVFCSLQHVPLLPANEVEHSCPIWPREPTACAIRHWQMTDRICICPWPSFCVIRLNRQQYWLQNAQVGCDCTDTQLSWSVAYP